MTHCPTCQGYNRSTTDMVCMTCGRDYMEDDPVPGLGWKRLMEAWREQCKAAEARLAEVRAKRDVWQEDARRFCQNAGYWRDRAKAAEAHLAEVLAVPACRDTGHTEALHIAAKCCDPYESPCAAYVKSMRASAWERRGEGDRC